MNIFEKNIDALLKKSPILAVRLLSIPEVENFEIFVDSDPINLNIVDKREFKPLFATKPVDEILKLVHDFNIYSRYPLMVFFGIGNGIFYKLMLSNITEDEPKILVVIEPDLELLYIALNFTDFSQEIMDERFFIFYKDDCNFPDMYSVFSRKDMKVFLRLYDLHIHLPYYSDKYKDEILEVNKTCLRAIESVAIGAGNDVIDSMMGWEHHILNLPQMVRNITTTEFRAKAKNSELAIIVSTGPSLSKQLPLLKEIQDSVTIFCIDASMPILEQWGIKPDYVLTLERAIETAKFYETTSAEFQKDITAILVSIVHPHLLANSHSEQKILTMRRFGYCKYFKLDDYGYLGIGMSAANMALEAIFHSGFKRMVFIGQDLSYAEDGKSHAQNHVYGEDEIKTGRADEIWLPKYGGDGFVKSYIIWKLFLNYFENAIADVKGNMECINSTEGGARINGTIEMSFADVVSKYVDKNFKKEKVKFELPHEDVIKDRLIQTKNMLDDYETFSLEIKAEIDELFLDLMKETEELEVLNREDRLEEIDFDRLLLLIERIDKIKQYFGEKKFADLFLDTLQSYIYHQELELAKIQVRHTENDLDKKVKLIDWIYAHKYWLFSLSGGIDAQLEICKRARINIDNDPLIKL